jgi:hypothetical protein
MAVSLLFCWSQRGDLNSGPTDYESQLPLSSCTRKERGYQRFSLVTDNPTAPSPDSPPCNCRPGPLMQSRQESLAEA